MIIALIKILWRFHCIYKLFGIVFFIDYLLIDRSKEFNDAISSGDFKIKKRSDRCYSLEITKVGDPNYGVQLYFSTTMLCYTYDEMKHPWPLALLAFRHKIQGRFNIKHTAIIVDSIKIHSDLEVL